MTLFLHDTIEVQKLSGWTLKLELFQLAEKYMNVLTLSNSNFKFYMN